MPMPNIYAVTQYFFDGEEAFPIAGAFVIAMNADHAKDILRDNDTGVERRLGWTLESTKVKMIGWATGDINIGILGIAKLEED